ncbi:Uu.00g026730.m01.CDS01 [Anthostomella pinea]|uniref:Uu.00g026730.m01.CDS01 n=1 Tax=Anthostomella pinea TaxID=933095 RepID=A0AAI8V7L5_9PEZI|nr:Uu.00g026730.m01.CDS01 [Anthostomella pinea]
MAAAHHVLLLGGSGKVAQLLTPMLLQRSWNVTSIIRNPDQVANLQKLGENQSGGKLNVLVRSLEEVKSDAQAQSLIDEMKPDYVVFSAGAGGKGAPERTFTIDRDAACHFIRASVATPSITKFVMISFTTSRLAKPSWWDEDTWKAAHKKTLDALPRYYEAKVAADQVLYEEGKKRSDFAGICLRPSALTMEPSGKVTLGKTVKATGTSSRASVANLTALLLEQPNVKNCWLDMLDGDEDPEAAVKRDQSKTPRTVD